PHLHLSRRPNRSRPHSLRHYQSSEICQCPRRNLRYQGEEAAQRRPPAAGFAMESPKCSRCLAQAAKLSVQAVCCELEVTEGLIDARNGTGNRRVTLPVGQWPLGHGRMEARVLKPVAYTKTVSS